MINNKGTMADILLDFVEKYYYAFLVFVLLIACTNLFSNLNTVPINDWDEARHGVNAYEMLKSKNYIVNTYGYEKDYYNLKPPLSYWLVMAGYKLVGFNPLGLRLFSAVAALLTIIIVTAFVKQKHGKIAALISASVLTTTIQYMLYHGARAGDADSIYVLCFTIAMISMAKIQDNIKWLYLCGLSFSFAFLAKSWHAAAIVAVGGLFLLFSGQIFKLKPKQWMGFIISSILPILIWGIFRYSYDGLEFFKGMINYDLLARTSTPLEGHNGNAWYYFNILKGYYIYWFIILFGVFIGYLELNNNKRDKERKNYMLAIILWILVPFIAFTAAKTKLHWYIFPIYPALAICIGAFSAKVIRGMDNRKLMLQVVILFSLIISLALNEKEIIHNVKFPEIDGTQVVLEKLKTLKDYKGVNAYTMCGTYDGPKHWDQKHFLAAELYGDLKPKDGGLDAFMRDNSGKALLVIPRNNESKSIISDNNFKTIVETDTNFILTK